MSNPNAHRLDPSHPTNPDRTNMSDALQTQHPPDICLLLRVHAEQRWLVSKVIPALRQLELPSELVAEERGATRASVCDRRG